MSHCLDPDVIDLGPLEIGGTRPVTVMVSNCQGANDPGFASQNANGRLLQYGNQNGNYSRVSGESHPSAILGYAHMAPKFNQQSENMSREEVFDQMMENTRDAPFSAPHVKEEFPPTFQFAQPSLSAPVHESFGAKVPPAVRPPENPPAFDFTKFAMMPAKAIDSIYAKLYPSYKPNALQTQAPFSVVKYSIPNPVGFSRQQNGYNGYGDVPSSLLTDGSHRFPQSMQDCPPPDYEATEMKKNQIRKHYRLTADQIFTGAMYA